MKIVTYNVNGLRQRISQFGSLLKLLNSFDADIICFQETKLRRQELTADVVMADGYESFFSCTRTSDKGRLGYSGVATFCRVNSAFSSNEAALPVSAEEGFSGLLQNNKKDELPATVTAGLEDFEKDELLQIDSEGRCIITDHGHFILFNLYGPRAESDDTERIQFKLKFFKILQKRWEHLLRQGRRIFVVGDLNIAPAAIDRCDAGPDFEKNEFRTWLRSMTVPGGGPFFDVFRAMHPDRKDAYTCWPSNTGAEQFNFGSRIDHILSSGSCLHENWEDSQDHNFIGCHVMECDILTQYKRWRPENALRWKGGWSTKLEGSDHAPVYVSLMEITDIAKHDTPSLSTRYFPMIRGLQQTIVSLLTKRQVSEQVEVCDASNSSSAERITMSGCSSCSKRSYSECNVLEQSEHFSREVQPTSLQNTGADFKKKTRKGQSSQLSLTSFFQKSPNCSEKPENPSSGLDDEYRKSSNDIQQDDPMPSNSSQDQDELIISCSSEKDRNSMALLQWQRIQQLMQDKIPLCKGHKEPCVSRIVKKAGPNFGRRFYTCARAEGPSSNPEANCGFFKWSGSKSKQK